MAWIAGRDSEAEADVTRGLKERFPPVHIVFHPALVEGIRAVDSMIDALGRLAASPDVDVIILARGGGSVADLVPFDDERLCRAIFACGVPVVTAIGHTKQRPNCDHVASASSNVPGRAAELVVPDAQHLREQIARVEDLLDSVPLRLAAQREEIGSEIAQIDPRRWMRELRSAVLHEAERITYRADSFYRRLRDEIGLALDRVSRLRERMPSREDLSDVDRRLTAAGRRLQAKAEDYRRAVGRITGDASRDLQRRLQREREGVQQADERASVAARRRIELARRDAGNATHAIRARDFRRRGWALVAGRGDDRSVQPLKLNAESTWTCASTTAWPSWLQKTSTLMKERNMSTEAEPKQIVFEDGYERLKEIGTALDSGDVPVGESCELFAEGKGLGTALLSYLDAQEAKIQEIEEGKDLPAFEIVAPSKGEDRSDAPDSSADVPADTSDFEEAGVGQGKEDDIPF